MNLLKKIIGILTGTMFVGMGVALYKLSSLGQDSLSAMIFSVMYLINIDSLSYMFWYILINLVFFIIMIIFLRKKINVGSVINLILTGVCSDLFLRLFLFLNLDSSLLIIKIVYGILGLVIVSLGIALYGSANLGIAPYDSMPIILSKKFKKLPYKYARIIIDLLCTIVAIVIGVIILRRTDIIGINTILTFVFMGPLISLFSKIFSKHIYKDEKEVFN